ncbi:hypothetical protein J6590_008799 [Homalodisca vitripennis]|nr:hypothetical protein J6590_008799 [Homalodisca vitripennis]
MALLVLITLIIGSRVSGDKWSPSSGQSAMVCFTAVTSFGWEGEARMSQEYPVGSDAQRRIFSREPQGQTETQHTNTRSGPIKSLRNSYNIPLPG